MAKWLTFPSEPFFSQTDQQDFLRDRRRRLCKQCNNEYLVENGDNLCPTCSAKGSRIYDRLLIIAGRRWGKTRVGSIASVDEACIPNTIGWACAPTNPKLHRYIIPAFQQLIPEDWVKDWDKEYLDLRLKNGSLIHFQTLEDPDQGRGQGLDWLWIDEVCELSQPHWDVIRPSLAGDTVAFFTTSPRSFDWVYKELYKPAKDGIAGYWVCHAKTVESANPRINSEFLGRERAQMSPTMFAQEYEADFVNFTGAVYGELVSKHILRSEIDIKRLLPEWPQIADWRVATIGLDTGADHPFGAVKLVAAEKGLVVVGEYLERNRTFAEHSMALQNLARPHKTKWAINKNERQPIMELDRHGIRPLQPAENDQLAGTERVKTWLYNNQLWFIEAMCPKTIEQMLALRYAEVRRDGQDRDKMLVFKKNDELPDCIRYAAMTFPSLPVAAPPAKERDISMLPLAMQDTIKRLRRIDKPPEDDNSVVQDFWA